MPIIMLVLLSKIYFVVSKSCVFVSLYFIDLDLRVRVIEYKEMA